MQPSKYQLAIYDHQDKGDGDAFVGAVAGSGKTTTLKALAGRLPEPAQQRALFCAFNKHIADELKSKLPGSVNVSTIHAMGAQILRRHLQPTTGEKWINGYKYERLARIWCSQKGVRDFKAVREISRFLGEVTDMTMLTLTDASDPAAVQELAERYDLYPPTAVWNYLERETGLPMHKISVCDMWKWLGITVAMLQLWGQDGAPQADRDGYRYGMRETISFTDMIYLPTVLELDAPAYSTIYVDEVQDLNAAQREFLFRLRAEGGRMTFVGDERQAIYGFAGADIDSVRTIAERTGAARLPLSICYRCPRSHIELAQAIVPEIEPAPAAIDGAVEHIRQERVADIIRGGDMILCRTNAPLVSMAFKLIRRHIPAKVRGREIGQSLCAVIDSVESMDGYTWEEFPRFLDDYERRMIGNLARREDTELQVQAVTDRVECVRVVHHELTAARRVHDAEGLRFNLRQLFSDESRGVTLSSVHKAKGLEADRVFLLHPELMPFPKATGWQLEQEFNLKYVALTRAKRDLFFVME